MSEAALPPCAVSCFAASIVRLRPTTLVVLSLRPLASSLPFHIRYFLLVFGRAHQPALDAVLAAYPETVLQCAAPSWRVLLARSRTEVAMNLLLTFPSRLCAEDSENLMIGSGRGR